MIDDKLLLLYVAFFLVVGVAAGYFLRILVSLGRRGSMDLEVKQILLNAREEAKNIISDAQKRADETRERVARETIEAEERQKTTEDRLIKKEELLDKRQLSLDTEEENLKTKLSGVTERLSELSALEEDLRKELSRVANLSEKEAREKIFESLKSEYETDLLHRLRKLEMTGEERTLDKAREILTSSIHRLGNSVTPEIMSVSITLESEDSKGKIIGKEGRNIRTFERIAGVELVIDDTPNTILISSFDPVRREIARRALESLILDGRIQPARIEDEVKKAEKEVNEIIKEKGEEAVYECGIYNLDSRITSILGRLHFRTSYGQNALQHSIEVSHLAGMIAAEVGADVMTAKIAGLVHDIGKAADQNTQGSHVEIGKRILEKFDASPEVIKAMQAHHEEYPYETIESKIVQVADSISASRPGARRDSVENYLNRLAELEKIALGFPGVEKAFALQAGHEIRIFVSPDDITDLEAVELARDVARKIEEDLRYPGEIKVNVIRESRAIEYAR